MVSAAVPGPAQARFPGSFVGMLSIDLKPYAASTRLETRQLAAMHRLGVGVVRGGLTVRAPAPSPDRFFMAAARRHIRVMPLLLDTIHRRGGFGPRHGLVPPRR